MPATESNFRDVKKVHVVFALTSIILLFTTLWMMGADQAREWTGYQRKFDDLQTRKQLAAVTAIKDSPQYETSKADIDAKKESAQKQLATIQPQVDEANKEFAEADRLFDKISRKVPERPRLSRQGAGRFRPGRAGRRRRYRTAQAAGELRREAEDRRQRRIGDAAAEGHARTRLRPRSSRSLSRSTTRMPP